ncbi:uncharacterized protein PHACADRAFT_186991 [Phanerochaete carnosa HHB-10118-sp]|uniref:Uncharacterized protein n=1 Tax=Phanerochaete carnosa (strain HHB-10118-sp) TaxID=650164 RepID=K5VY64_PHACS|nr:uncharacterized protein PHACADRAFT_186991 [Phanerochaete carnosa HHB-10118-sp]EKM51539.1 hypothetical protein PHACADRAFT_186991 [Phanerochaete carnosa HHB-10118-sp]
MSLREYKYAMALLSLVCRAFRDEGQKRLFRFIAYHKNFELGGRESEYSLPASRQLWHDLLHSGNTRAQHLAGYVRECTFTSTSWTAGNDFTTPTFVPATLHFRRMEKVTIRDIIVNASMLITLVGMPFLRTVTIEEGALVAGSADLQFRAALAPSTSKWTSFTFKPAFFGTAWSGFLQKIVNLDGLEYLSYDVGRINPALVLFRSDSVVLCLKELFVRLESSLLTGLVPILERAPRLFRLSISHRHCPDSTTWQQPNPLPLSIIPHLQELITTHESVVSWLLPGSWTAGNDFTTPTFVPATLHFRRMEKVTIRDIIVNASMLITLVGMPFLRTVTIEEGALVAGSADLQFRAALAPSTSKWTSFTFKPAFFGTAWSGFLQKIVNLDGLEYLSYDVGRINPALVLFRSDSVVLCLKELFVRLESSLLTGLVPILERAPRLFRLSISHRHCPDSTTWQQPDPLPPKIIPHLQELITTHESVVSWLLPGRSVSSLTISGDASSGEAFLAATKTSAAGIRELNISVDLLYILAQEGWPALRTLSVQQSTTPNLQSLPLPVSLLKQSAFRALQPLPSVTSWVYHIGSRHRKDRVDLVNLRLQQSEIITKLEITFPNADRFRFGEAIEWRRDGSGSREWRPCVHSRILLLDLLVEEYDEMQDVAGFLAVFRAANNYCKDMELNGCGTVFVWVDAVCIIYHEAS